MYILLGIVVIFNFVAWSRPGGISLLKSLYPFSRFCFKVWLVSYLMSIGVYIWKLGFALDWGHILFYTLTPLAFWVIWDIRKDSKKEGFDIIFTPFDKARIYFLLFATLFMYFSMVYIEISWIRVNLLIKYFFLEIAEYLYSAISIPPQFS